MKNRLWLFYPENDIALAHGTANFTAPPAAVKLRRSGAILPLWMADDADRVLCHGINASWLEKTRSMFGIRADVWNHIDTNLCPTPWGWSEASRMMFVHEGFPTDRLPDSATLKRYRDLSHRRTATRVGDMVAQLAGLPVWNRAVEITDAEQLRSIILEKGCTVVKAPWSSSGRGVAFVNASHLDEALRRAAGTIRKQGSVMVEDFARDKFDFAMLFFCEGGVTRYEGLSVFSADDATGSYHGNIVDTEENLCRVLASYLPADKIASLKNALLQALDTIIAPSYDGPVGVDLFVTEQNGVKTVHVVEINLRWTMGFLARSLSRRIVGRGLFEVQPGDRTDACHPDVENGRLTSGSLALNPPGGDFTFILTIPTA